MKHLYTILLMLGGLAMLNAQTSDMNYIKIKEPDIATTEGTLNLKILCTLYTSLTEDTEVSQYNKQVKLSAGFSSNGHTLHVDNNILPTTIQYFDGYGSPIQTIAIKGSPDMQDVVTYTEYDDLQRVIRQSKPFCVSSGPEYVDDAANIVTDFYNDRGAGIHDTLESTDSNPFYENSYSDAFSLNTKSAQPGIEWNIDGEHISESNFDYAESPVQCYIVNFDDEVETCDYEELQKKTHTSEEGKVTAVYSNQKGQVLVKEEEGHTTLFVYDKFENLRFVIPPLAMESLSGVFTEDDDLIEKYCYTYIYDDYNRLIEKRLPGCEPVYYVYDFANMLTFSQDGEQRSRDEWTFYQYDIFKRLAITGIGNYDGYSGTTATIHEMLIMQAKLSLVAYNLGYIDIAVYNDCDEPDDYMQNTAVDDILEDKKSLIINYYDNYNFEFNLSESSGFSFETDDLIEDGYFSRVKGMLTGTKENILGTEDTLYNVNYYDDHYRVIQNCWSDVNGNLNRNTTAYDFLGNVIHTKEKYNTWYIAPVDNKFAYDHANRLLYNDHRVGYDGSQDYTRVAEYSYDELGRLVQKDLHITDDAAAAQRINYTYHKERDWLTSVTTSAPNNSAADYGLFELYLRYNEPEDYNTGCTPKYDGTVSSVSSYISDGTEQYALHYNYTYDTYNQLTDAVTYTINDETYTQSKAYALQNVSYDAAGNINSLERYGKDAEIIDELAYDYSGTGNLLNDVQDYALNEGGFTQRNYTTRPDATYAYDDNGNMISDGNSYITSINYNLLNLPDTIIFENFERTDASGTEEDISKETVTFLYSASGAKLKMNMRTEYTDGTITVNEKQYVGSIVLSGNWEESAGETSDVLPDYVIHSEGRMRFSSSGETYEYHLRDHLGNVRVAFQIDADGLAAPMQWNNYYPFGMVQENDYSFTATGETDGQVYKFNGKEQMEWGQGNWLDYGARFYNPAIARWHNVDPLAEKYWDKTPFAYVSNNPINLIDPDGMSQSDVEMLRRRGCMDAQDDATMNAYDAVMRDKANEDAVRDAQFWGSAGLNGDQAARLSGGNARVGAMVDGMHAAATSAGQYDAFSAEYGTAWAGTPNYEAFKGFYKRNRAANGGGDGNTLNTITNVGSSPFYGLTLQYGDDFLRTLGLPKSLLGAANLGGNICGGIITYKDLSNPNLSTGEKVYSGIANGVPTALGTGSMAVDILGGSASLATGLGEAAIIVGGVASYFKYMWDNIIDYGKAVGQYQQEQYEIIMKNSGLYDQ